MPKNYKTVEDESILSNTKNRKIKPTSTTITNYSTTTSSSQEKQVVIVLLDFKIGSMLLTNCYKTNSKFKINSKIIINNIHLSNEIIYHTKHSQSIPPQLLYRGSRDGFKSINFHSKCDYQGPTLTIIKSAEPYNQIFGGFTLRSWKFPSTTWGEWSSDSSAFIFKIDEKNQFRKFNIKQPWCIGNAIYSDMGFLTMFGGDIVITSDCNLNNDSFSLFGHTYELPSNEFHYSNDKAHSYLAGSYNFTVVEIEVFKIVTIQ